jgi:dienelactone hydrolase
MRVLRVAAALLAAASSPAAAARLLISPATALVDDPVVVRVTGLRPRQVLTLTATTVDRFGNRWSSRLRYAAGRTGNVDTRANMRLFYSMKPVTSLPLPQQAFLPPEALTPVSITAIAGGRPIASGRLLRRPVSPDVTSIETTLPDQGFTGTYAARPDRAPAPAVLIIGGSVPGHRPSLAQHLASGGFPSLAIGYWGEPGLPGNLQNIPLEYFEKALRWLAGQPGVDPNRIVTLGISRGGEAALELAVSFPGLVHGAVTCSGGNSVFGGLPSGFAWTLGGKPLPLGPIAVEEINGPVVAFAGGQDRVWSGAEYARSIAARGRTHGRLNIVARVYTRAGHGAGCLLPNVPLSSRIQVGPSAYADVGGTTAANEASAASSWPLLLHFLASV